jgi:hypothetical protein
MESRVRARGKMSPATPLGELKRYSNCSNLDWVSSGFSSSSLLVGEIQTFTDVITANFNRRRSEGVIIFNPMSSVRQISSVDAGSSGPDWRRSTLSCSAPPRYEEGRLTGPWVAFGINAGALAVPPTVSLLSSSDINDSAVEASTAAFANRGKADSNLFESLAEYRDAVALLKDPIAKMYRLLHKQDKHITLLGPTEGWLVYRYGIRPIISDINNILKGLDKSIGKRRITSRGYSNLHQSTTSTLVKTVSNVQMTYQVNTSDQVQSRAMSLDEYIATKSSNIGFTTKGLLGVPWELVPYSFVADWFVNVGDFLYAHAPAPGYKQLGSCLTTERTIITQYVLQNMTYVGSGISYTSQAPGAIYSQLVTKTRSGIAKPGLVIRSDFQLDGLTRTADAFFLLKQILDRKFDPHGLRFRVGK